MIERGRRQALQMTSGSGIGVTLHATGASDARASHLFFLNVWLGKGS
jgi:hypothetical protein